MFWEQVAHAGPFQVLHNVSTGEYALVKWTNHQSAELGRWAKKDHAFAITMMAGWYIEELGTDEVVDIDAAKARMLP